MKKKNNKNHRAVFAAVVIGIAAAILVSIASIEDHRIDRIKDECSNPYWRSYGCWIKGTVKAMAEQEREELRKPRL